MKGERQIAGLRCSQVLEQLSDYFDDELDTAKRKEIEAHVRECNHCERFGGVFANMVRSLRIKLGACEMPKDARQRLLDQL